MGRPRWRAVQSTENIPKRLFSLDLISLAHDTLTAVALASSALLLPALHAGPAGPSVLLAVLHLDSNLVASLCSPAPQLALQFDAQGDASVLASLASNCDGDAVVALACLDMLQDSTQHLLQQLGGTLTSHDLLAQTGVQSCHVRLRPALRVAH